MNLDLSQKLDRAELFKALADETRLKIVHSLFNGEKCVSDLMSELDLAQSHVSHHLKILKVSGIITSRRDGHKICYFLSPGVRNTIDENNDSLDLGCCEVNFK
ncbi:MAG: ArsR/SmtB family transcription factor [Thermodesulfobacteriota bacterium]